MSQLGFVTYLLTCIRIWAYKGGSDTQVEKLPVKSSLVLLHTRYCLGYQIKEYEMGSACGTQGFDWET
jgi:hypothetical protein